MDFSIAALSAMMEVCFGVEIGIMWLRCGLFVFSCEIVDIHG